MQAELDLLACDSRQLLRKLFLLRASHCACRCDIRDDNAPCLMGKAAEVLLDRIENTDAALVHQKQQEIHDGIGKLALIAFHQELLLRLALDLRILEEAADLCTLKKILPHTCQLITIGLKLVLLLGNLEDCLGIFACKL